MDYLHANPRSGPNGISPRKIAKHALKNQTAVGKIVKLESFNLERNFQLNDLPCINKNLERPFQHKTFQLNDLSNYSFQLHTCP